MKGMTTKVFGIAAGLAAVLGFSGLRQASDARAEGFDGSMPHTVVVGAPRGAAPSERVDGRRSGQSKTRLPFPPTEKWRRHLGGNIELPPVVDDAGRIIVALTVPEIVALGPDGKEVFRTRIGASSAISPPVLTSDGTLVVVTMAGAAVGVGRDGRIRFATPLGVRGRDVDAAPIARADGSVVLGGRMLVELDETGAVRSRAALPERAVGALLEGPEGTIATAESGSVYVFRPPNAPRKLGSFGGPLRRGAVLEGGRTLLAVVGGKSVVGLDMPTGLLNVRLGDAGLGAYDEPIALHPRGFALVTTSAGLLLGLDGSGNEKLRVFLEKGTGSGEPPAPPPPAPSVFPGRGPSTPPAGGFFGTVDAKPSPPLVVDKDGRVAFARTGGRVGVARADGNVALAGERMCNAPVALQPAGEDKMVLVCRDGTVWMLGI
jgi:hypothetical protein